jgi:hypothetical protein
MGWRILREFLNSAAWLPIRNQWLDHFLAIVKTKEGRMDTALIVKVNLRHEGPFYSANSEDVPGLHVCEESLDRLCDTVRLATKTLFKHNRHMEVEVLPATRDAGAFPNAAPDCLHFVVRRI